MIVKENVTVNGVEFVRTTSDSCPYIRCGRHKYKEAFDPVGVEVAYFEEGVEENEQEDETA